MKQLLKQSWIYLLLLAVSSPVFAHVAAEHALPFGAGLVHMLSEPVHVYPLSFLLLIVVLYAVRRRLFLPRLRDWIDNRIFRL